MAHHQIPVQRFVLFWVQMEWNGRERDIEWHFIRQIWHIWIREGWLQPSMSFSRETQTLLTGRSGICCGIYENSSTTVGITAWLRRKGANVEHLSVTEVWPHKLLVVLRFKITFINNYAQIQLVESLVSFGAGSFSLRLLSKNINTKYVEF